MAALYRPEEYFERALEQFSRLPRPRSVKAGLRNLRFLGPLVFGFFRPLLERPKRLRWSFPGQVKALTHFVWNLPPAYRHHALEFLIALMRRCPERLPGAMLFIFTGAHFYRYTYDHVIPKIDSRMEGLLSS